MKAKELIEILKKMEPETELSLYCGGEGYHGDHPLGGIEHSSDDGQIVFNLTDEGKYGIVKEVDKEDFINSLKCLEINWNKIDQDELEELFDDFQNSLAEDDVYNQCYNNDLYELISSRYPELCEN